MKRTHRSSSPRKRGQHSIMTRSLPMADWASKGCAPWSGARPCARCNSLDLFTYSLLAASLSLSSWSDCSSISTLNISLGRGMNVRIGDCI